MQHNQFLNTVNKVAASRLSKYKNLQHCFWFELCVRDFKHAFVRRRLSKFGASRLSKFGTSRLSKCQNFQLSFFVVLSYAFKILNMHFVQDAI